MDEQPKPQSPEVFAAMRRVMEDMARVGVAKLQQNTQQNFRYRGIDDVMDALAGSLAKHGLLIVPHVRKRLVSERPSRAGGTLLHTLLKVEYDFIAANDGSMHTVGPVYGESMDAGDKSTNKAMAAAYKYACVQTFCIPVRGDDPDAESHEVAGTPGARSESAPGRGKTPQVSAPAAAPRAAPSSPETPNVAPKTLEEVPLGADGKPRILRPGGDFGYGKKFAQTPWSVMASRDLEWFLSPERSTPANIRTRIAVELAWRAYETSQLQAAREHQRASDDLALASDDIPFDPVPR